MPTADGCLCGGLLVYSWYCLWCVSGGSQICLRNVRFEEGKDEAKRSRKTYNRRTEKNGPASRKEEETIKAKKRKKREKGTRKKPRCNCAFAPLLLFCAFYLLLFTHKHIKIALYSYVGVCVVSSSSFSSFLLAAKNVIPHPRKKEKREKSSLEIVLVWFGSTIDLFYSQIFFVWLFLIVAAAAAPSIDAAAAAAAFICCNGAGAAAPAAAAGACLFSAR